MIYTLRRRRLRDVLLAAAFLRATYTCTYAFVHVRVCITFFSRRIIAISFAVYYQSSSSGLSVRETTARPSDRDRYTTRNAVQRTGLQRARRRFVKPRPSAIQSIMTAPIITSTTSEMRGRTQRRVLY